MGSLEDPFVPLHAEEVAGEFDRLTNAAVKLRASPASDRGGAIIAKLHGFDLDDRPLLSSLPQIPGEVVASESTVELTRAQIGSRVVVLFEDGNPHRPIVVGVLENRHAEHSATSEPAPQVSIQADDDRFVVSAEREIVLRCGDASITLTRAGKVIIKGNYILSRSSGYNKIKGAAVDIN